MRNSNYVEYKKAGLARLFYWLFAGYAMFYPVIEVSDLAFIDRSLRRYADYLRRGTTLGVGEEVGGEVGVVNAVVGRGEPRGLCLKNHAGDSICTHFMIFEQKDSNDRTRQNG